jgi:hypothetical protein
MIPDTSSPGLEAAARRGGCGLPTDDVSNADAAKRTSGAGGSAVGA